MKSLRRTGKTLLGALAFANVGNLAEFRNLLLEPASNESAHKPAETTPCAGGPATPAGMPAMRSQQAM